MIFQARRYLVRFVSLENEEKSKQITCANDLDKNFADHLFKCIQFLITVTFDYVTVADDFAIIVKITQFSDFVKKG